jgi:hypothetical protein
MYNGKVQLGTLTAILGKWNGQVVQCQVTTACFGQKMSHIQKHQVQVVFKGVHQNKLKMSNVILIHGRKWGTTRQNAKRDKARCGGVSDRLCRFEAGNKSYFPHLLPCLKGKFLFFKNIQHETCRLVHPKVEI